MIENLTTKDKSTEAAERKLEQVKAQVAEKQKKENAKRRKAENHHKYMMGGIIVKYFPCGAKNIFSMQRKNSF